MADTKMSEKLWRDCKSDQERADFILCGRAHETGVIATSIQSEVAMAFQRLATLQSLTTINFQLPNHEPTIAIGEILDGYDDDGRDDVWESIKAYADVHARSALEATPLPADAALDDAVALLRRTHQNHWPSIEIKAFLAKIDAMPDARLRALSQPEVAQVPAVPMAAIETVLHFCSPHEDASKEDCSKCSAAYEEVSNWRDALLSAAPSAKGGEG